MIAFAARQIASGELPYHLAITLARVAAAFVIAMTIGVATGLIMGRSAVRQRARRALDDPAPERSGADRHRARYIWIGLNEVAAILAVALNKIPNATVTIREGTRALDTTLMEMARTYRFSRGKTLRHVILPQLQPYIAATARSGLALIWKIVLVVELLGRSNGIGFQIYLYFQSFDVRAILAYTLVFVGVMLAIELAVVQPLGEARLPLAAEAGLSRAAGLRFYQ